MSLETEFQESGKALKAFLVSYFPQDHKALYPYLWAPWEDAVKKAPLEKPLTKEDFLTFARWYGKIHNSWYLPFLESLPPALQKMVVKLFPVEERDNFKKWLPFSEESYSQTALAPLAHYYLFAFLQEKMGLKERLPPIFYNDSLLFSLLGLTKRELVFLIDLLGIYDLAYDIHKIVDKNLLQKIYAALTVEETNFLSYALKQQSRYIPLPLHLQTWSGDKKKLKTLIHYRGLQRLSYASAAEEEGFRWLLAHMLDSGRGTVLLKLFQEKRASDLIPLIPYFQSQVLGIVKRIRR